MNEQNEHSSAKSDEKRKTSDLSIVRSHFVSLCRFSHHWPRAAARGPGHSRATWGRSRASGSAYSTR